MKYIRKYLTGGGTWYNDGIVDIKITEKTTTITQNLGDKPPVYSSWLWNKQIIKLKGKPDDDLEFVIYHYRQGTPFVYTKITA